MPESAPGPKSASGSSGNDGSTWFQFVIVPSDSGAQIVCSCSTVMQSIQSFSGFTTTEMPSLAITISVNSMPAAAHLAASSSSIGRDAFERSV